MTNVFSLLFLLLLNYALLLSFSFIFLLSSSFSYIFSTIFFSSFLYFFFSLAFFFSCYIILLLFNVTCNVAIVLDYIINIAKTTTLSFLFSFNSFYACDIISKSMNHIIGFTMSTRSI